MKKNKLKHAAREYDHALLKDYGFTQIAHKWRDGSGDCIERRSGNWWCDGRKLNLPLAAWLARRAMRVDEEPDTYAQLQEYCRADVAAAAFMGSAK